MALDGTEGALERMPRSWTIAACVKVRVLAPQHGGLFWRPLAPDSSGRGRFPRRVRLKASLLSLSMGELTIESTGPLARVDEVMVVFPGSPIAIVARLLEAAEDLAREASWTQMWWRLGPEEQQARRLAWQLGFRPVSSGAEGILFHRPLGEPCVTSAR